MIKLFNNKKEEKKDLSISEHFITRRNEVLKKMRTKKWVSATIGAGEAFAAGIVIGTGVSIILKNEDELNAQQKFVTIIAGSTCAMMLIDKAIGSGELAISAHTRMKSFKETTDGMLKDIKTLEDSKNLIDNAEPSANPEVDVAAATNEEVVQ